MSIIPVCATIGSLELANVVAKSYGLNLVDRRIIYPGAAVMLGLGYIPNRYVKLVCNGFLYGVITLSSMYSAFSIYRKYKDFTEQPVETESIMQQLETDDMNNEDHRLHTEMCSANMNPDDYFVYDVPDLSHESIVSILQPHLPALNITHIVDNLKEQHTGIFIHTNTDALMLIRINTLYPVSEENIMSYNVNDIWTMDDE